MKLSLAKKAIKKVRILITDSSGSSSDVSCVLVHDDEKWVKDFEEDCPEYNYLPSIYPKAERIIVIGDLHGDYGLTVECLKLAKVIDDNLKWIGKKTVVVQIGDQIDRCRPYTHKCDHPDATINDEASDIKIMKLFTKLHKSAVKKGGAVFSLVGNHELMNVDGNMNYVSHLGLKEFENYRDPKDRSKIFSSGVEGRKHAFKRGNEYSKFMGCTRQSTVIVGSNLFAHAGILPEFSEGLNIKSENDLNKINKIVRRWLMGNIEKNDYIDDIVKNAKTSMFWNRILGNIPPHIETDDPVCAKYLEPTLKLFGCGNMIIGHTPQFAKDEGINGTCNKKLWRIDNGSSAAFSQFDKNFINTGKVMQARKAQVLEILNDSEFRIIA